MGEGMKFRVKRSTGCCKTVSTVIEENGKPEVVTIDLGSGKISYGPEDPADEALLEEVGRKKEEKPQEEGE